MQNSGFILIWAIISLFLVSACDRPTANKSNITFELPPTASIANKVTPSTVQVDDYIKEPTSIDDINCFYIVAAGPEEAMSNIKCGITNADQSLSETLNGGILIGGVPRSSPNDKVSIEAEIPSGTGRHFYLLGVKRKDNNDCFALGDRTTFNGGSTISIRSNVYVLGHSDKTDLVAGDTATVGITMSLTTDDWIDSCTRTTPTTRVPADPAADATKLFLAKTTIPSNNRAVAGKCQPFEFELRNDLDRLATLSSSLSVKIETALDENVDYKPDTFSVESTYSTYGDCSDHLSAQSSFTISSGSSSAVRWIKVPAHVSGATDTTSRFFMRMTPSISTIIPSHFSISSQSYSTLQNASASFNGYEILGPRNMVTEKCYKFQISHLTPDGTRVSLINKPYRFANYGSTTNRNYSVYSDADCTTDITTGKSVSNEFIYVKNFKAQGAGRSQLVVQPANSDVTSTLAFLDMMSLGFNIASNLAILGPKVIPTNSCGAFMLTLVNQHGSSVTNGNTALSVNLTSGGSAQFYSSSSCSTGSSSATLTIPSGQHGAIFYMKGSSSGSISATGGGFSITVPYMIENFLD
jgi:hypothetical protein